MRAYSKTLQRITPALLVASAVRAELPVKPVLTLHVGQSPQSGKKLSDILDVANFRALRKPTCKEALAQLNATPISVVIREVTAARVRCPMASRTTT